MKNWALVPKKDHVKKLIEKQRQQTHTKMELIQANC